MAFHLIQREKDPLRLSTRRLKVSILHCLWSRSPLPLFHTPPALLFFLFPERCILASASDFVLKVPVFFAWNVLLPDYLHGSHAYSFRFLFIFHHFSAVLPDNSIKTLTSYCTLIRTPYPSNSALALFIALTHHLTHCISLYYRLSLFSTIDVRIHKKRVFVSFVQLTVCVTQRASHKCWLSE